MEDSFDRETPVIEFMKAMPVIVMPPELATSAADDEGDLATDSPAPPSR